MSTEQPATPAYRQGVVDGYTNKQPGDSPYIAGTPAAYDWEEGRLDAAANLAEQALLVAART